MKNRREETSPLDEIKFKAPFTCIISGPSGSGKSSFCIRLLQNLKSLCTESRFDGGIIWCYSEKTAVPSLGKINVSYHEGVPEEF
jgi:GTPase SAR1 family protein